MIFIYALIDPFTFKVRYIGKTIKLKQRYQNQLNESSNTHRCNWIKGLLSSGKKPIQVVLQELEDCEDWQKAEMNWIRIAKKYKWNLVNSTDGGDGVTNLSKESKEKMLKTWTGRKHKPETLVKLSKASKGRIKTQEQKDNMSAIMSGRKILWVDKLKLAVRKFDESRLAMVKEDLKTMGVQDAAKKYNVHRTTISKIKLDKY